MLQIANTEEILMASLEDVVTIAKNIVTAINGAAQSYVNVQGAQTITGISASTSLKTTAGRVAVVSVTTAGSTVGTVYDGATSRPLWVIPNTVGVYVVNMPVTYGILVNPGTSQVVAVSFS